MSNPLPPLLDGLAGLIQITMDTSAARQWSQVEDLEREERPLDARTQEKRAGTALSTETVSGRPATATTSHAATDSRVEPGPTARPTDAAGADRVVSDQTASRSQTDRAPTAASPSNSHGILEKPAATGVGQGGFAQWSGDFGEPKFTQMQSRPAAHMDARVDVNRAIDPVSNRAQPDRATTDRLSDGPAVVEKPADAPTGQGGFAQWTGDFEEPRFMRAQSAPAAQELPSPRQAVTSLAQTDAKADVSRAAIPEQSAPAALASSDVATMDAVADATPARSANAISAGTATAGIAHVLSASGPLAASQKLHEALRQMSPQDIAAFIEVARSTIGAVVTASIDKAGPPTDRPDDRQRAVQTALTLAHVASVVDRDIGSPSTARLLRDISSAVMASQAPNDATIFAGLAQAIGVGAGAKLALSIAQDMAHEERDGRRTKTFLKLMLAGFLRLEERIDEAHQAVLRQLGPLLIEWAAWRAQGGVDAVQALAVWVNRMPTVLDNLELRLDRLEQAGLEAFRAVRDLSAFTIDAELREVRGRLLSSEGVFGAITSSRAALRDIKNVGDIETGPTLDMIRLNLTRIGFDLPRAAFLADLSLIGGRMPMDANWTALEDLVQIETQGRAFQRLLAFLNGQYVVAAAPEIVTFDDEDMSSDD